VWKYKKLFMSLFAFGKNEWARKSSLFGQEFQN
jgi:hypothetical protein